MIGTDYQALYGQIPQPTVRCAWRFLTSVLSCPPWFGPVVLLVVCFVRAQLRGAGLDGTGGAVYA